MMAGKESPSTWQLTPARIAVVYLLAGGVWILVSDRAVAALPVEPGLEALLQTAKGWFFVGASGLLIYLLVARGRHQLRDVNVRLRRALEQSSVLHRVLRHNLRNACNVLRLEADALADRAGEATSEGERRDPRETIERQTERLLELSEKARHLREIVHGDQQRRVVDLDAVIDAEVDAVEQRHPKADVEHRGSAAPVTAYPEIEFALEELLENAVEHYASGRTDGGTDADTDAGTERADAGGPTIQVDARTEGDAVIVDVCDDGPGIPEMERAVLERGVERQLSHSQGLGLWIVRAIVTESGGGLQIVDGVDGTTVRIELPVAAGADVLSSKLVHR